MQHSPHKNLRVAKSIRLNSYLAQAGLGSRRGCERLIVAGEVVVDGRVVRDLATMILPDRQTVKVKGQVVQLQNKIHVAFYKPAGCVCTRRLEDQSKTIYDFLPPDFKSLFYVGRLDRDTEGLLFLTNDGDWAQRVAHPRHEIEKIYLVEVMGRLQPREITKALHGVRDEDEILKLQKIRPLNRKPVHAGGCVMEVVLREGKKREIRRLFRALHHPVLFLKRIQIGGIKLADLPQGQWRNLTEAEVKSF